MGTQNVKAPPVYLGKLQFSHRSKSASLHFHGLVSVWLLSISEYGTGLLQLEEEATLFLEASPTHKPWSGVQQPILKALLLLLRHSFCGLPYGWAHAVGPTFGLSW